MIGDRLVNVSERWFRLLQRLYPPDFRDDMGDAVVETYRDRARDALRRGGILRLAMLWVRALLVGMGVLIGVPGIYVAGGLIRGVLVANSPSDPLTLAAVATGLGLVTMVACYVPARRVLGIDPAQSLRQE